MSNNINTIYTTVSNGQTHIAADTKYIGSVDSYNNGFTQLFAWTLGRSINVNFDGKVRTLNKESYENLIRNLAQSNLFGGIDQYTQFRPVAENVALPNTNMKMRDVITNEDRNVLFQKLAQSISSGNTTKALLMIGKGAELDKAYFERNDRYPSFYSDTEGLFSETRYAFNVFHAAPIMQAAKKANSKVVEFLKEAGANTTSVGQEYAFKREIVDVQRNLEFTYEPRFVPHHHHHHGYHHTDHRLEYRPALRERTTVLTQDSRDIKTNYKLDNDLNLVSA